MASARKARQSAPRGRTAQGITRLIARERASQGYGFCQRLEHQVAWEFRYSGKVEELAQITDPKARARRLDELLAVVVDLARRGIEEALEEERLDPKRARYLRWAREEARPLNPLRVRAAVRARAVR